MIRGNALNGEQAKPLIEVLESDHWGTVIVDFNPILSDWEFLYDEEEQTLWCGQALVTHVHSECDRVTRGN